MEFEATGPTVVAYHTTPGPHRHSPHAHQHWGEQGMGDEIGSIEGVHHRQKQQGLRRGSELGHPEVRGANRKGQLHLEGGCCGPHRFIPRSPTRRT